MQNAQNRDEIDLVNVIKVCFKYWKPIVFIPLLCALVAGAISISQTKVYQAKTSFFPMPLREYVAVDQVSEIRNKELSADSLILSLLNSKTMVQKIIFDLGLKDNEFFSEPEYAYELMRANKDVTNKGGIFVLLFKHEDPKLAADIANSYVDNLTEFNQDMSISMNHSMVNVIDRAEIPKRRMPRKTGAKMIVTAFATLIITAFFVFIKESYAGSNATKKE